MRVVVCVCVQNVDRVVWNREVERARRDGSGGMLIVLAFRGWIGVVRACVSVGRLINA